MGSIVASNGLITDNTAPRTTSSDGTRWSHTFTAQDDTLEIEIGQIVGGVAGEQPKYTVSAFILSKLGSAPSPSIDAMVQNITLEDNNVIIEFEGTLKRSTNPSGPYTVVEEAISPYSFQPSDTFEFFIAE